MKKMKIKPAVRVLRDPTTLAILPHDVWTEVPVVSYWVRRVRCGDAIRQDAEIIEPAKPGETIVKKPAKSSAKKEA